MPAPAPPPTNTEGRDLFANGPYRTMRPLAAGGMGELFVVEHRELGRTFVAKVLQNEFRDDPTLMDRFRLEARNETEVRTAKARGHATLSPREGESLPDSG